MKFSREGVHNLVGLLNGYVEGNRVLCCSKTKEVCYDTKADVLRIISLSEGHRAAERAGVS